MNRKASAVLLSIATLLLCFAVPRIDAQQYEPSVGQEGKDVIWVPTPEDLVNAMLDMGKVGPEDYVIDLGSGDGRIVIAAAKRGARATGFEYNPNMVELSKLNAEKAGVAGKADFVNADLFESDFSQATVITMYLLPHLNMKLRPKILDLKPGIRIVSHAFTMEDWDPDETENVEGRSAYLWIVPAKVAGIWRWRRGSGDAELKLNQTFQKIDGTLRIDGKDLPLENAKLEGAHISFAVSTGNPVVEQYAGSVNGNAIEGAFKRGGRSEKWSATRQ